MKWRIIVYIEILALLLIDIISKYIFEDKEFLFSNIIYIKYSMNYGSSFSLFSNINYYNYIVIFLSIMFILILLIKREYFNKNKFSIMAFFLMITGILGNLYDRIIFGFVRDFIGFFDIFIFNLADLYLNLAIICFLIYEFKINNNNNNNNNNNK